MSDLLMMAQSENKSLWIALTVTQEEQPKKSFQQIDLKYEYFTLKKTCHEIIELF